MKLVSLNVEGGKHLNRWLPAMVDYQPDVLCLQEVFRHHLPLIEKELGMKGWFALQMVIAESRGDAFADFGEWGVAILTRKPIKKVSIDYYKGHHLAEEYLEPNNASRALMMAEIEHQESLFRIGTVHFTWSAQGLNTEEQARDLESLISKLEIYPDFIVCGDFNIPRGTDLYKHISQRFKSWVPYDYRSSLDPELFRKAKVELVVDHLFTTPHYEMKDVKLATGLSDHCAIFGQATRVGARSDLRRRAMGF